MQVRADHAVSVGLIRWPHRPSRCTVVLKLAFGAGRQGDATLLPDALSVTIDRYGGGGILGAPSDFAPFKPRCDVVLVGSEASGASDARLTVHTDGLQPADRPALDKVVQHARLLAARPTLGELSDPSDPVAEKLWSESGFDFARFQCAAPDQRVDFPRSWLAFRTEIGGARFGLTIPVGLNVLAVVDGVERPVPVQADGFLIDPASRRCSVSYRGVIEAADDRGREGMLVVSTQASNLAALLRAPQGSFRAGAAIEPKLLRRLVALSPEPSDPRIIRAPSRTVRMTARTERLVRPVAPDPPPPAHARALPSAPPPPAPAPVPRPPPVPQPTILPSTQDLLIDEVPSDEQLAAAGATRPAPPALAVQDTVTLMRSDLAALDMPDESFDNEVTVDEDAARHTVDHLAPAASVALDEDSWSEATVDRTPALSSRRNRPVEPESVLERSDTLTITGEAPAAPGVVLPFRSQLTELEASHTMTISADEADSIALPFSRPKTVPPAGPKTVPPPPPALRPAEPLAPPRPPERVLHPPAPMSRPHPGPTGRIAADPALAAGTVRGGHAAAGERVEPGAASRCGRDADARAQGEGRDALARADDGDQA